MFLKSIYNHRSWSWNFVIFNVVVFVFIKLALSPATYQLATLLDATPRFSSIEIIQATNAARLAHGLPALAPSNKLNQAAQEKLNDMAAAEYFAHISPSGVTPWYWVNKNQYNYIVAGENLAIGFLAAQDTIDAWMKSPSHRANIVSTGYLDIGVAVGLVEINNESGILVVQMFGSPSSKEAAASQTASTGSEQTEIQGFQGGTSAGTSQVEPPAPTPIIISGGAAGISLQHVSTDENIPPATKTSKLSQSNSDKSLLNGSGLESFYFWYTLILAITSLVITLFVQRTKANAIKAAVHTAIFLGAAFLPTLSSSIKALIF